MKKQYIAPISERVFPESIMEGMNPGGGHISPSAASQLPSSHVICAPGRDGLKYL